MFVSSVSEVVFSHRDVAGNLSNVVKMRLKHSYLKLVMLNMSCWSTTYIILYIIQCHVCTVESGLHSHRKKMLL